MCELWRSVNPTMAQRYGGPLSMQCLWFVYKNERFEPTARQKPPESSIFECVAAGFSRISCLFSALIVPFVNVIVIETRSQRKLFNILGGFGEQFSTGKSTIQLTLHLMSVNR